MRDAEKIVAGIDEDEVKALSIAQQRRQRGSGEVGERANATGELRVDLLPNFGATGPAHFATAAGFQRVGLLLIERNNICGEDVDFHAIGSRRCGHCKCAEPATSADFQHVARTSRS